MLIVSHYLLTFFLNFFLPAPVVSHSGRPGERRNYENVSALVYLLHKVTIN
jgi:hypothetical protein